MTKDIKYAGYSAVPSDFESPDGQLALSLNLIHEDGGIKPLTPPKQIGHLDYTDQQLIFIHKTSAFTHYISYDTLALTLSWSETIAGESTRIDGYFSAISHLNAVGNTLLVFTTDSIQYILWQDDKYISLGDHIPNIEVSFGLVGHPRLFSISDDSASTFSISFAEGIAEDSLFNDFSEANKTSITDQVMAKVNKFIREQTIEKGRFCFPFFVRYALRLFDGSLVGHSAPILMNPSTLPAPIVLWSRVSGKKSYTDAQCDIMLVAADLDFKVIHDSDYYLLDKWSDIITGIEVFISKPLYTYDQEGKISRLSDNDNFDCRFIGRLFHNGYHRGGALRFASAPAEDKVLSTSSSNIKYNSGAAGSFLDVYAEWSYSRIYTLYFSTSRTYPSVSFHLPEFSDAKAAESVKSCSLFYKLKTISLDEARATDRSIIAIDDDYLQSLVAREVMTDDYLSHDRLAASSSQAYNSRINLSGVKREPFTGFSPASMLAYCNSGIASISVSTSDSRTYYEVNVPLFNSTITSTVYIKENGAVRAVQAISDSIGPWLSEIRYKSEADAQAGANGVRTKQSWGCFLFYPNSNAVKIVIRDSMYQPGDDDNADSPYGGGSFVCDLSPHEFLNGAFAFIDYGTARTHNLSADSVPSASLSQEMIDSGNKVFTSQVNNPFFFPLSGINAVGSGRIMAIATAAKALSQGQFGQFPLYAFTDEGVWAMEVSATGTYSAKQPITRDVCINPDSITQIDSAVLFATDRGIMLISGSQTQCISDAINSEYPFDVLSLPGIDRLHAALGHSDSDCLPIAPFSQFLKSAAGMIYDYVHQRIIVYSTRHAYAYVYSIKSQAWGLMFSNIARHLNSYPDAIAVLSDGDVVNFSHDTAVNTGALLVSRPLKFDAPDIHKTIDTVIQRGHFRKGNVQSVLYGSCDLYSWHLVWSSKDHFLRGFRGTPYKFFRIALLCDLAPDESIFGASVRFTPRLTNNPR